jgi:glutaredoxin 3
MTDVEIYSSMFCGFCNRAKELLAAKGVAFTEFDVSLDAGKRREMLARSGGRRTVPQIFIGGRHVGGWNELSGLERKGELDRLLGIAS